MNGYEALAKAKKGEIIRQTDEYDNRITKSGENFGIKCNEHEEHVSDFCLLQDNWKIEPMIKIVINGEDCLIDWTEAQNIKNRKINERKRV